MVTTADIEKLFKQYLEKGQFECADALYLCVKLGRDRASQTLWLRYHSATSLTVALEDVRLLGINDPGDYDLRVEDSKMRVSDVITAVYENLCLDELFRRARERLYEYDLLPRLCNFIFQLRVDSRAIKRAVEELVACYIFQHPEHYSLFPDFFDKLIESLRPELETCLPKIEVRVVWPST